MDVLGSPRGGLAHLILSYQGILMPGSHLPQLKPSAARLSYLSLPVHAASALSLSAISTDLLLD